MGVYSVQVTVHVVKAFLVLANCRCLLHYVSVSPVYVHVASKDIVSDRSTISQS